MENIHVNEMGDKTTNPLLDDIFENEEYIPQRQDVGTFSLYIGPAKQRDLMTICKAIYDQLISTRDDNTWNKFCKRLAYKSFERNSKSVALDTLDEKYREAMFEAETICAPLFRQIIALYYNDEYGDSKNLVAFTSIPSFITVHEDTHSQNATIYDAYVCQGKSLDATPMGNINIKRNLYDFLISNAEEYLQRNGYRTDVTFKTIGNDGDIWGVASERGYQVGNGDGDGFMAFTKILPERELHDERNSSR